MIVSEKNVSDALAYLAQDPHPVAVARLDLLTAENNCKSWWSKMFLEGDGTIDMRKASAETDEHYQKLKEDEAEATYELERHKQRTKAADSLIEVWRSENANARSAEKVR